MPDQDFYLEITAKTKEGRQPDETIYRNMDIIICWIECLAEYPHKKLEKNLL